MNIDQWIIGAAIVNILGILALVLMFKDWPRKSHRH